MALDVETRDPELLTRGPGFKYGEGEVVGVSMATEEGSIYLPFGHRGGDNLDEGWVWRLVQDRIRSCDELIMANAGYDLGWLDFYGVEVPCKTRCVQVAEALLDEERYSYSLDSLSKDYLGRAKDESLLREAASAYGIDPKAQMYLLPARYVGRYAEIDALNTLDIYAAQEPLLMAEGLWKVWELECAITKICVKMTSKGVSVDLEAADQLNDKLRIEEAELSRQFEFNVNSSAETGRWCESQGISVPKTLAGNYSVTKEFRSSAEHPIFKQISRLKELQKLRKDFIEEGILRGNYRGRIHASFLQTARDDGGTRSGRFSARHPNVQQVPKRSEIGKKIRKLYIADSGKMWAKADYSSQEPRLQVHYGMILGLSGAAEAARAFSEGVKLYAFLEKVTGLPYDTCKMLVLGMSYGMGVSAMAVKLGISEERCLQVRDQFNEKTPYIRLLFDRCVAKVEREGELRTILGRKMRFDWWTDGEETIKGYDKAAAMLKTRRLKRAFTHKAMNRLIQGGSADQTKMAMVLCDEAGIDIRMPVHDEINANVQNEKEARLMREIMESAIELKLSSVADLDLGATWC